METLLATLLAAAAVICAWLWTGRKDALARERRLKEEIGGMKRASLAPLSLASSPDLRPLFPDARQDVPAASAVPSVPGPGIPPDPGAPARSSPPIPSRLLEAADRHRDALRALDERLSRLRPFDAAAIPPTPVPPSPPAEPGASPLAASVDGVGSAVEQFVDQSTRLRNDLEAVGGAVARVIDSLDAALPIAREAAHQTEALSPFVSGLSGLADRVNLLSLDVSLAGEAPGGGTEDPRKAASVEIRVLFDELRSFSRSLGARVRNATEAARRSGEAFTAVRDTAEGARERNMAASGRAEALSGITGRLEEATAALASASSAAQAEREKLGRTLSALEQRLAAERQVAHRTAQEVAAIAEAEEAVREAVREERRAAEELSEGLRAAAGPE